MRALLYCNEALGLGHLRLSLVLADELVAGEDRSSSLVVTGSPAFAGLRTTPGVDLLKLPAAPIDSDSAWSATSLHPPASLSLDHEELRSLRSELSLTAARELDPCVVVVDYRPLGRGGELRPTLRWLRERGRSTVALGLWDVDDRPERLRAFWSDELAGEVAELFDLAIVYGPPPPGDVRIAALDQAGVPVKHVGLVGMTAAARGPDDLGDGYLLGLTGGGIDGYELLESLIDAVRLSPPAVPTVIVSGPMMPPAAAAELRRRTADIDVHVIESRPDMDRVLGGARAVVSMAGYCTVAEILGAGKPALLVPRGYPREEQLNRARRWATLGAVEMIEPAALSPASLAGAIPTLLAQEPRRGIPLTGARDAAALLTRDRAASQARHSG